MAGVAKKNKINSYTDTFVSKIGINNLVVEQGDFVKLNGGFVDFADTGDTIEGVSQTDKTFDSDNQTVAMEKVSYRDADEKDFYEIESNASSLANADVGSYFDLETVTQLVDYSTKSTLTGQLKLEEVISTNKGVFSIANK